MPGEEVPKDEQDENKVDNLRLKFLEELQGAAKKAFVEAGVAEDGICPVGVIMAQDFQASSGWVNASDTWTCKLADSENDIVKSNVNAVSVAGARLLNGIDAEISNIHANGKDKVDENDEDAKWKPF